MLIQIILGTVGLFLLAFYFLYYSPKLNMEAFAQKAKNLGYKVKLLPFIFMRYYVAKYFTDDQGSLQVLKNDWSKYDLVVGNMFHKTAVMVGQPQLTKDLCNQMNKLQKNPFISEVFQAINGGGLVFTQGQTWKRKRRIISSVFHFDFLNEIIPVIEEQINQQFQRIDNQINKGRKQFDLSLILTTILSNVVAKSFFGTDMKEYMIQGKPYCEYYVQFLNDISAYLKSWEHMILGMKGYRLGLTHRDREMKRKNQLLAAIVQEITSLEIQKIKQKKQSKKNILTALYENGLLNLDGKQNPQQYTMFELIGEFFIFFAAGTDTTANTVNIALHYLSQKPQHIDGMLKEINEIKKQNLKQVDKLKQLKYCEAIFNESLRINGPVAILFTRKILQNITVGALDLPKGLTITISPLLACYRETLFPQPFIFKPQIWLNNQKIEPYSFIPFSAGQRNCIGQYLARIEGKLLLSRICERYKFKALNPIKMKAQFIFTTRDGAFQIIHRNDFNKEQFK